MKNYLGKYLLKFMIKTKQFEIFPSFIKIFPKSRYKAISSLMCRGYLDLAYKVWKNSTEDIKEFEKELVERILSMQKIKEEGVKLEYFSYITPKTIHPLFVVHNSLPYDKAGYSIRTHSIVTKLKDKIDLEVVTRAGYPWDLLKHRVLPFKEKDMIDRVEYIRLLDKEKTFKRGSDLNYINIYANEIIRVAKEKNSTILHASSNYLNALAALKASETLKLPVIYEMRGLWYITRTTLDTNFKFNGMYEYEEQMEKACAIYANRIVVISEALRNLVISWGIDAQKIKVVPNAVDITKFQPLAKEKKLCERYNLEGKTVIGFLGSLTKYEGLNELVVAVNELIKEGYNDLVLMIVGDGREKESLESLVESKNIIFTGLVPFEEVDKYYSLFDICPFPRNDYEVCRYVPPLKILEAMAMQKAIIVSDVAPLLEMVENNKTALVCKANSVIDLKVKILELYSDKDKLTNLGHNARIWVQKNRNWLEVSKKYEEIYNEFK